MSQISRHGESFQEHLGQNNGRADIHHDPTPFEAGDHIAEDLKIAERHFAGRGAAHCRLLVDDIRTDRCVDGDRNPVLIAGRKDTQPLIG